MVDETQNDNEDVKRRIKDEGEGDADSFGRGKAGAASGMARRRISLSPSKLKEVMANWRHLDMDDVVDALSEFFSDWPMRASANLSVTWERTKTNAKSFAIVNWAISVGEKIMDDLRLTRERTASSGARGLKKRGPGTTPKVNLSMKPQGPSGSGQ